MNAEAPNDSFDKECALLARTRALLGECGMSHLEIYRRTGLKPTWLKMIANGDTAGPSVNRVVYLYEFLSGSTLTID